MLILLKIVNAMRMYCTVVYCRVICRALYYQLFGAISVQSLKEGENMAVSLYVISVFGLVLTGIQTVVACLERYDRKKKDSSARDPKRTDKSDETHTGL